MAHPRQEDDSWQDTYPRPQLRRDSFFSLDGSWLLDDKPIVVPFPPQAPLSGWQSTDAIADTMHYQKDFTLPKGFAAAGDAIVLHFGAVDQLAQVFVNGRPAVRHEGGYLAFSADVTALLAEGENRLEVLVQDPLSHTYPYGKQRKKRGGMWYTPVSGIWQSVWMEAVPAEGITGLRITPDLQGVTLEVKTTAPACTVCLTREDGAQTVTRAMQAQDGEKSETKILRLGLKDLAKAGEEPRYWTPDDPYLYRFTVATATDTVRSYFALRTVTVETEQDGRPRICLNGKPIFLHGVLDQGYFADGHYLGGTPNSYAKDILDMKHLGFNMLRKHIKIEPEQFYYACDSLGMLVLQDMVNNGGYHWLLQTALPNLGFQRWPDFWPGGQKRKEFFTAHMLETQRQLYNHPCIIGYTIFNEGWGQFHADEMYRMCKQADPSRLYDATSGWFAQHESDVESYHVYFRNKILRGKKRPVILSECGGFARMVEGHLPTDASFGYGKTAGTEQELTDRLLQMYREMVLPSVPLGLCGCVLTQLSDVEDEVNGLYTADREICKVNAQAMRDMAEQLQQALAQAAKHVTEEAPA